MSIFPVSKKGGARFHCFVVADSSLSLRRARNRLRRDKEIKCRDPQKRRSSRRGPVSQSTILDISNGWKGKTP